MRLQLQGRHGGSSGHLSDMHSSAFAFQGQLMGAVSKDPGLKALAGDAFRSFVRAYATHPASLRDVFHVRRLHLGHVAHSFALKWVLSGLCSMHVQWEQSLFYIHFLLMHMIDFAPLVTVLVDLQGSTVAAGKICKQGSQQGGEEEENWRFKEGKGASLKLGICSSTDNCPCK